ncbi:MAG: class I SAM-dependent methyltransferase [Verrucomicrobiales bacterium]
MSQPDVPTGTQRAYPYPLSPESATTPLAHILAAETSPDAPLSFQDFMRLALYHPEHGYYTENQRAIVSKDGDFITSVSVGPAFGFLIALRLEKFWRELGQPEKLTILELGAHRGELARDLLTALPRLSPDLAQAVQYLIIEPLEKGRQALNATLLRDFPETCQLRAEVPSAIDSPVFFIANELLDALPVPLLHFSAGQWQELGVRWDATGPAFAPLPELRPSLRDYTHELGQNFPEGYLTEAPPDFNAILAPLRSACRHDFLGLLFDYGFDAPTLHHPGRHDGSLRAYYQHSSRVHPLDRPGRQDLTAHVNFTAFTHTAETSGFQVSTPRAQGSYLTHLASDWLLKGEADSSFIRQFQTLIHPSHFGNRFHALELTRASSTQA